MSSICFSSTAISRTACKTAKNGDRFDPMHRRSLHDPADSNAIPLANKPAETGRWGWHTPQALLEVAVGLLLKTEVLCTGSGEAEGWGIAYSARAPANAESEEVLPIHDHTVVPVRQGT